MLWQDSPPKNSPALIDDVVDCVFRVDGYQLPVDHADQLSRQVCNVLPWLSEDPRAAVLPIHVASSGNGWNRPENTDQQHLTLSRRTRLTLRIPEQQVGQAQKLTDQILTVDNDQIKVGVSKIIRFSPSRTVFSRSVCFHNADDEQAFSEYILDQLASMNIVIHKMLCGLTHTISTASGPVQARSLLFDDVTVPDSIKLQQLGIGPNRIAGCGVFLPHKSLGAVVSSQEDN